MEFLNVLTRNEMKNVKGGGHCEFYCCTSEGCGEPLAFPSYAPEGTTNEQCQSAGTSAGAGSSCEEGEYLGALYFSGPSH